MLRVLVCDPVPQLLLHVDHAVKLVTTQCTGQALLLHPCVSATCGQTLPPCNGFWVTLRERLNVPPPHVTVHVVFVLQGPTTQSTGQLCALHALVSCKYGHA